MALAILPNSNIVSGGVDNTIIIWNSTSSQLITTLFGHNYGITALTILPDSTLISSSKDGTLKNWIISKISIGTWHILKNYNDLNGFTALTILLNSYIVSGRGDLTIKICQLKFPYKCIATLTGHINYVNTLAILPNSNTF